VSDVIEELRDILCDPARAGERLNELADEFRLGRDVSQLSRALHSEDSEIVGLATWILGELPFVLYDSQAVISRLWKLTRSNDPSVRFEALGALFPALRAGDPATESLLDRLVDDPNVGVRIAARSARDQLTHSGA